MATSQKKIYECLNEGVIGQEEATRKVAGAVARHISMMNEEGYEKSNVLIIGDSGTGKTEIIRQLKETKEKWGGKDIPIISFDASRITEEGYKGLDAIDILRQLHGENKSKILENTERGIVHLDEIDKILWRPNVLNALLIMIEGGDIAIEERNSGKIEEPVFDSDGKPVIGADGKPAKIVVETVNTSKILFILSGVFREARDAIENQDTTIGFTAKKNKPKKNTESRTITHDDLLLSNKIPEEFLGRIRLVTQTRFMEPKQWEAAVEKICRAKYKPMFDNYGMEFDDVIPPDMLKSVAKKFYKSPFGMRACYTYIDETISDNQQIFEKEITSDGSIDDEETIENDSDANDPSVSKAAEAGGPVEQFNLGWRYRSGDGVPQDNKKAVYWYKKAAGQGHVGAQCNLGFMHENGYGVSEDHEEAVRWYHEAAKQGHDKAQCNLGFMYEYGKGVPKDYEEAVKWYAKAAEQGSARGQFNLGLMYDSGKGVSKDHKKAAYWYKEAVKWYRLSALQGDPEAQFNLGISYEYGRGVDKDDEEAVRWYREAAEQGNAKAQCNLGFMYEYGRGVPKDLSEAVEWYRKAAEQGNAKAQCNIANMYEYGKGVPKDYEEAVKWYAKAAEQGSARGQFNLGISYEDGRGVDKDDEEAVRWYQKAAEQGYERAKQALERLSG